MCICNCKNVQRSSNTIICNYDSANVDGKPTAKKSSGQQCQQIGSIMSCMLLLLPHTWQELPFCTVQPTYTMLSPQPRLVNACSLCQHCLQTCLTRMSPAPDRLFELGRHERAKSHQSASSSHDIGFGTREQSKPAWNAAIFGPSGLLPGQTHTPTRIGRDLHELVAQSDQQTVPGESEHYTTSPSFQCVLHAQVRLSPKNPCHGAKHDV